MLANSTLTLRPLASVKSYQPAFPTSAEEFGRASYVTEMDHNLRRMWTQRGVRIQY